MATLSKDFAMKNDMGYTKIREKDKYPKKVCHMLTKA